MVIHRFQVSTVLWFYTFYYCNPNITPLTILIYIGIGLPGVAASGTIAANTIAPVTKQLELMQELKSKGALQ